MFEYISGKLTIKKIDYVALEINGLAYKIHISLKTFEKIGNIGNDEKLYIFTNVKEDNISFYGFKTQNERELFKELITIKGGVRSPQSNLQSTKYRQGSRALQQ